MNLKSILTAATLPFEQGCTNQWHTADNGNNQRLSASLHDWLFDQHSLTQRLQAQCDHFAVEVLREGNANISKHELTLFSDKQSMYSREVLLICNDTPHVYARTLMPQSTLRYADNLLARLGNTSLGQVLFNSSHMQRQAIETTKFELDSPMTNFCAELGLHATHPLWARRSIFTLEQHPLMVSEVFLPGSYPYKEQQL